MLQAQKLGLIAISGACSTSSREAFQVIKGLMPADLLIKERYTKYKQKREYERIEYELNIGTIINTE